MLSKLAFKMTLNVVQSGSARCDRRIVFIVFLCLALAWWGLGGTARSMGTWRTIGSKTGTTGPYTRWGSQTRFHPVAKLTSLSENLPWPMETQKVLENLGSAFFLATSPDVCLCVIPAIFLR
ncbi:hypothetical protein B0H63DRAFT_156169 [Podospora didyma]|uniref:Uncharacterized protein n=1 Tax=Podospora didyma TaxID=330526 RepID=A0AAE0U1P3_9PEZI|nr:hypothetical protein B0H63DRAFT_156169 [Podospora didyma]